MPLNVMQSQMRPSADLGLHFMCSNFSNSNPKSCECAFAKVSHGRARLLCFSIVFIRLFGAHGPASVFRAGVGNWLSHEVTELCSKLERDIRTGRVCLLARRRRVFGHGQCRCLIPCFMSCHTKTSRSAFHAFDCGQPRLTAPMSRA